VLEAGIIVAVEDLLSAAAARHPNRPAVVEHPSGLRANWFVLDDLAGTWLRRLRREGLEPGDRLAVVEPAGVRFAALLFACLRLRCAMVPLSPRAPERERQRLLDDARPRGIVEDGELTLLEGAEPGDAGDAFVLYTSGTTGRPKGVRQTLRNHLSSAAACRKRLGTTERDRWLLMLQPHHVGGLAMFIRSTLQCQPVIALPEFDEAAVLDAIARYQPTLTSAVPTMVTRLLEAGGAGRLRTLRAILLGGARGWSTTKRRSRSSLDPSLRPPATSMPRRSGRSSSAALVSRPVTSTRRSRRRPARGGSRPAIWAACVTEC
jgi:O-succinylbenzoic acid--CoA ligase